MRDPKRLAPFYYELATLHEKYFPDLRFGQLMYNFFSWYGDPFYLEEGMFLAKFKEYIKDVTGEDVP